MKFLRTKFSDKAITKGGVKPALNGWNHHSSTQSEYLQRGFATMAANERQAGVACLPCWEMLRERVSVGRRNSELPKFNPWTRCLLCLWLWLLGGFLQCVLALRPTQNGLGGGNLNFRGQMVYIIKSTVSLTGVSAEVPKKARDKEWLS